MDSDESIVAKDGADRADRPSAPPHDLLARAFLDILARAAGAEAKPLLRSGDPSDPIEQMLDDLSSDGSQADHIGIRPDIAAVAILTARAVDAVPGLIREFRHGNPLVTIGTHSPDLVSLVAEVIEQCAFSSTLQVLESGDYGSSRHRRTALMIVRDGTDTSHRPEKGNDKVAMAVHAQSPIVGIAPAPRRHLPRDLLRAAEYELTIGDIDENALEVPDCQLTTGITSRG
jgi:hypothetical protein